MRPLGRRSIAELKEDGWSDDELRAEITNRMLEALADGLRREHPGAIVEIVDSEEPDADRTSAPDVEDRVPD
jgi:hypothetical protein